MNGHESEKSEITQYTPELLRWAKESIAEEEVVADLKELREKGGLELNEFIEELERILNA